MRVATTGLEERLAAIERSLDAGTYRRGAWSAFVRGLLDRPRAERIALAPDVSRVSERLHRRAGRRTVPFGVAVGLELAAVAAGGVLLAVAFRRGSNAAAIATLVLWTTAFEPLVKITAGIAGGIRFSHAYLLGIEPRFKMRYGSYVAAPAPVRVAFHLAGCVGSPLGAWLVARLVDGRLAAASVVAWVVLWVVAGVNGALLVAGLAGARGWGPARLGLASGGAAAAELRRLVTRSWPVEDPRS